MTMTAAELMVIMDTLRASLALKDNGALFSFGESTRRAVLGHIGEMMQEIKINVECEEKS